MIIYRLEGEYLEENTYIIMSEESGKCLVVDPGAKPSAIDEALAFLQVKCTAVLLTHAHFDHIYSAAHLQSLGAVVYLEKSGDELLNSSGNLAKVSGCVCPRFHPQKFLQNEDVITEIGLKITFLHTPGHSCDSGCYLVDGNLFCGDTLFRGSYGATHFPTGDFAQLRESIKNILFELSSDTKVFDGHTQVQGVVTKISADVALTLAEPVTTIGKERMTNPINYEY